VVAVQIRDCAAAPHRHTLPAREVVAGGGGDALGGADAHFDSADVGRKAVSASGDPDQNEDLAFPSEHFSIY